MSRLLEQRIANAQAENEKLVTENGILKELMAHLRPATNEVLSAMGRVAA